MTKKSVLFSTVFVMALCALCLLLGVYLALFPQATTSAFAAEKEYVAQPAGTDETDIPVLLINGQESSNDSTVARGESVTIDILYQGLLYVPELCVEDTELVVTVDKNVLSIGKRSRLGELLVGVRCMFDDGTTFTDTIRFTAVYGESIDKATDYHDRVLTLALPADIVSVKTTLYAQDYKGAVRVEVKNGEELNQYLAFAPHKTSGLTVEYDAVCLEVENADGEWSEQTANNGAFGLTIVPESTRSLSGAGTSSNPYKITSASDFAEIANYDSSSTTKYFKQTANFTLSGTYDQPDFYGQYWGNGKTITLDNVSNLRSAMFKENNGTITSLTLSVIKFGGYGFWAVQGLVCSVNSGTISNITVKRNATSSPGFLSFVNGSYSISNYIEANFSAALVCGGIAGSNGGTISGCEVKINMQFGITAGGIAGGNSGTISNCTINSLMYFDVYNSYARAGIVGQNEQNGQISGATITNANFLCDSSSSSSTYYPKIGYYVGRNANANLNACSSYYSSYIGNTSGTVRLPSNVGSTYVNTQYLDNNNSSHWYGNGTGIAYNNY